MKESMIKLWLENPTWRVEMRLSPSFGVYVALTTQACGINPFRPDGGEASS